MKYSKPEISRPAAAVATIQSQTMLDKGTQFEDRLDLQSAGPFSSVADPASYEADE
jgi:hypothetical protein